MKEHPILFSSEMIKAILERRKTQTRRVIRNVPDGFTLNPYNPYKGTFDGHPIEDWFFDNLAADIGETVTVPIRCPYGVPGDRLWVRETWATVNAYDDLKPSDIPKGNGGHWPRIWYRATNVHEQEYRQAHFGKWRPSIFMPRWASRITLEVVGVQVEQVQDITSDDCIAEGVERIANEWGTPWYKILQSEWKASITAFRKLWDSINAKRGYPWADNPRVWAVTFEMVEL